ncbi:hypothetical protein F3Y22_tig00010968pilonHSYRG00079 [Hibiscus syriacus]|uniref:MULE transposase domain-containing protein n=1 Tax=Hibiscus syriacus TaxID=106335 RepID=A0A6A3C5G1_HIBSY|nr:hypothetical protein F3Y22_tig00010968pilonHSYRG00079 [Hibiscus syriacus]
MHLENGDLEVPWDMIHAFRGLLREKMLFYTIYHGRLLSNEEYGRRHLTADTSCSLCGEDIENKNLRQPCYFLVKEEDWDILFGKVVWCIWNRRNQLIFDKDQRVAEGWVLFGGCCRVVRYIIGVDHCLGAGFSPGNSGIGLQRCCDGGSRPAEDNVKPTEECHEVHNADESDILVSQLFSSRDQTWYFYKGFAREHGFSARKGTTWLDVEAIAVSLADIDEATTLKEVSVGTSQVMNYLTQQAGGYHNVVFTHKDLYNALQRGKAKEIVDGDVNVLIAYFDYKKYDDPGFFMTYSVDESGALHNLIWSDSTSRSDYTCFGDVIMFDTTYNDNLYGRPIMPIVGVNHHHYIIVFATAIIADETSQYFELVLQTFLEAMMNKLPISVVTDGDRAMQRAIKSVIPYANHRLCFWHLSRNAQDKIGDPKFTAVFSKCMASWWTTEEFDIQWRSVVSEFNIEKNPWVIEKENTRHLWAQAYLTSHFFVNICSTQRYKSMNASLAIALKHKKTYLDVVRAIEDGISRMRMNELKADYLSSQTKPFQITKLVDLESHAIEMFTHKSFRAFQDELQWKTLYQFQEEIQSLSDECQHYILIKYKEKNRIFEISFDSRTETLNCSYKKFKTVGLLCRHQLHILKHLDYTYLPETLIQSRWTKDAKASSPSYVDLNVPPEVMQMARFAALRSTSIRLCYISSKTDASFKTARDKMKRLTKEFENSFGLNDSVNQSSVVNNVRDPQ